MKALVSLIVAMLACTFNALAEPVTLLIINMGEVQFIKVGTTIFDNRKYSHNLREDFDVECEVSALKILGTEYTVVEQLSSTWKEHFSVHSSDKERSFKSSFTKSLNLEGFSELVVIDTYNGRDPTFGTSQHFSGYRLATRGLFANEDSIAYLHLRIRSFDTSTLEVNKTKTMKFRRHLYETVWQDTFKALPQAAISELDKHLVDFANKAIPEALYEFGLASPTAEHVAYKAKPEEHLHRSKKTKRELEKALFKKSIEGKRKIDMGGMTCKKPYRLTQNCNIFNGAGLKVSLDELTLRIAGSEDGKIVLVMPFKKINDTRASNQASDQVMNLLQNHGMFPIEVDVVAALGHVQGYVLHYETDAFSLLMPYATKKDSK